MAVTSLEIAPNKVQDVLSVPDIVVQPIADLRRGTVVGYEALSRFSGGGSPVRWFQLADRVGLGAELEAMALRAALARRSSLPSNAFLSVNVSPRHLVSAAVRRVLEAAAPLHGIVIELTEQHAVEDAEALSEALAWLCGVGAHIALDDVGAGYAGLQWLLQFRPHFVKLDIELVRDLDRDEAKRTLVEMVGSLCGRLDMWVLAEGVERTGELDALVSVGIPLAQGYVLGRPGPEFSELAEPIAARLRNEPRHSERSALVGAIVERSPSISDRSALSPRMRVREGDTIASVARRVLTRPPEHRWDNIECRDLDGSPIGVVRVERIIEMLTSSEERRSIR